MVGFEVKPCVIISDVIYDTKLTSFSSCLSGFIITEINKNHKKY